METTTKDTPYFARNRDETDIAYQRGWDDYNENMARSQPYQKDALKKAYWGGYDAARIWEGSGH